MNRKEAMWWAAGLLTLVLAGVVGRMDHQEAQRQVSQCQEMRTLWDETDGQQGWPHC